METFARTTEVILKYKVCQLPFKKRLQRNKCITPSILNLHVCAAIFSQQSSGKLTTAPPRLTQASREGFVQFEDMDDFSG